jgi:hypothetical protein
MGKDRESPSAAEYACSDRDRHAPLTAPGQRGRPSLEKQDLGADVIPAQTIQHRGAVTTGMAPHHPNLTRQDGRTAPPAMGWVARPGIVLTHMKVKLVNNLTKTHSPLLVFI